MLISLMPSKNTIKSVALISGATGFVGTHLSRRLVRDGWQVHILCRAESQLPSAPEFAYVTKHIHDGGMQSMVDCVTQAKPDVVFHLASLASSQHTANEVDSLIQSNVLFGNQLLEAMKLNGVNCFINTGTFWQHFNNENYNPVCLYAATKQAFEAILEYYVQACGIKAITLELFDTYGPDDPRKKLFHLLNNAAQTKESLDMTAGEQLIDLVHIDDVVAAYLIAAKRLLSDQVLQHECYSVSSGHPLQLRKLVELFTAVTGRTVQVNWGAKPYRFREVMKPWSRGVRLEGWKPNVELEEGLKTLLSQPCEQDPLPNIC
jgi:nucleoside-diphosphate-sugar epimerase